MWIITTWSKPVVGPITVSLTDDVIKALVTDEDSTLFIEVTYLVITAVSKILFVKLVEFFWFIDDVVLVTRDVFEVWINLEWLGSVIAAVVWTVEYLLLCIVIKDSVLNTFIVDVGWTYNVLIIGVANEPTVLWTAVFVVLVGRHFELLWACVVWMWWAVLVGLKLDDIYTVEKRWSSISLFNYYTVYKAHLTAHIIK